MKKILSIFVLLFTVSLLFAKTNNKNDKQIFAFDSVDLDGNKISSEIYSQNKITMINIWGTFCGPCIREMQIWQNSAKKTNLREFRLSESQLIS